MCGFIQGGVCGFSGGGMRGFIWGSCMVLFGGHVWFYSGVCGFIQGERACMVFLGGVCGFSGGACVVFSVFSDTMRYGQ